MKCLHVAEWRAARLGASRGVARELAVISAGRTVIPAEISADTGSAQWV